MKKISKLISLLLAMLMLSSVFAGCSVEDVADIAQTAYDIATIVEEVASTEASEDEPPTPTESLLKAPEEVNKESPVADEPEALDPDGSYTAKEDVALYIHTYGCLPSNFITKSEARAGGWSGGSLEPYFPGMCIGGDYFGNKEGLLPKASGRQWTECDIDTLGADSRGAKRIVFSNDGLIYYTDDHYESFTLLYGTP